jgi:hypothetical protein
MNDKPFASLSPTLLARKGGAKPAMRSQLHYPDSLARTVPEDDLGWNDMGQEQAWRADSGGSSTSCRRRAEFQRSRRCRPAQVGRDLGARLGASLQSSSSARRSPSGSHRSATASASAAPRSRTAAAPPSPCGSMPTATSKLRLACTIRNRSAQQLVTEALDRLIDELPDLATLAAQVSQRR